MDYTFDKVKEMAGEPDEHGYRVATITLAKGDTAYAPGTTKYDLAGVGSIEYVIHPSGIKGFPADDAKVYRQLKPHSS